MVVAGAVVVAVMRPLALPVRRVVLLAPLVQAAVNAGAERDERVAPAERLEAQRARAMRRLRPRVLAPPNPAAIA